MENLHCVTFTGADDSVKPEQLVALSARYPLIEWGILFSAERFGTPRYPSLPWLQRLRRVAIDGGLSLSAHLCGRYARQALKADWDWQRAVGEVSSVFGRVQINCSNNPEPSIMPMLREWPTTQRIVIQCGDKNRHWVEGEAEHGPFRFDVLYDNSGGRGVLARAWPFAVERTLCGYAGGLGPCNIADEIASIEAASLGRSFWIDMESKVRSDDGAAFDLGKVREVLAALSMPAVTNVEP